MQVIKCKISCNISGHLSQLYTGFAQLDKSGAIELSQEIDKGRQIKVKPNSNHLLAILNDKIKIYYDTSDFSTLYEDILDDVDYYFKRSFDPEKIPSRFRSKLLPLGMNYNVHLSTFDILEFKRLLCNKKYKPALFQFLKLPALRKINPVFEPNTDNLFAPPDYNQNPKILFMVRAWNPKKARHELTKDNEEERIRINQTRADCIKLLRQEFGKFFVGGFQHTDYAIKNYKELLIEDNRLTHQKQYIKILKQYPICIATTGLHGSIGWKMAEYVAFSKAIISEKLNYLVPGDFKSNKNYLGFETAEQCVEKSLQLFHNANLRLQIMNNNHTYYQTYLKPDKLVWRTIEIGLSRYKNQ